MVNLPGKQGILPVPETRNMRNRDCKKRAGVFAPVRRVALGMMVAAIALVFAPCGGAQISTTTVQGTVYRADGTPAGGTLLLSWPAFTTPQNQAVAAGNTSVAIGADGFISVGLTPNANALPTGSYYTAVYHLSDGTVNPEYWVVPAAGNASIASVRAQLQPSTVAVQPVSKAYLDSAITSLNGSWLPLVGGTMTGPLNLNGDPAGANQASTKHYADQLAAAQLPLSGGTLTGPLNAKQIEGAQYADQLQSRVGSNDGMAMSLAQCASLPYACQVLAPATYAVVEQQPWGGSMQWTGAAGAFQGPPASAGPGCVTDQRFGGPEYLCIPSPAPNWNEIRQGYTRFSMGPSFTTMITSVSQSYSPHLADGLLINKTVYNGSRNFSAGLPNGEGQTVNNGLMVNTTTFAPATNNSIASIVAGNAPGDHIGVYVWDETRGGITAADNEGNEDRFSHHEAPDVYQGTIGTITGQASGSSPCAGPCYVLKTTQTQGVAGGLGDQLPVIDMTQADTAGYIASISGSGVVTVSGSDFDSRYGDSNAWGTITQAISNPNGATSNTFPQTNVTVSISTTQGAWNMSLPVCIFDASGVHHECQKVTSASSTSLTFAVVDVPHFSGSVVAQGGMTGMGFEAKNDEVGPGITYGMSSDAPPTNVIRNTWPIEYNQSGGVLQIVQGTRVNFSYGTTRAYSSMGGSGGACTATLSGGSIASCSCSGGTGYIGTWAPPQLAITGLTGTTQPTIYISGVSGGALTACSVANGGSGLSGTPSVKVTTSNPYAVYPMARTVNVWNPTTGAVDGSSITTDQLMPSLSAWHTSDILEQEHNYAAEYAGEAVHIGYFQQGHPATTGRSVSFGGAFRVNDYGDWMANANDIALYQGLPSSAAKPYQPGYGQMETPYGYVLSGSWRAGLTMRLPAYGADGGMGAGALVIGCSDQNTGTNLCPQWNQWSQVITHLNANTWGQGWAGEDVLEYQPVTKTWQMTAGGTGAAGLNPYCTESLAGNATGGFSITCNGKTAKVDTQGNLSLSGAVRAGGVTGATINGEITVDGTIYTTLNAAWSAATNQASATGQNQTIRLGQGTFPVTATLAEPTNGSCVSLIGSAAPTVTANNANASTVITVPSSLGGDLFSLQNTGGSQAQSCTFRNLMILANKNVNHAFSLQWFRGLYVDDVTVNDTKQDAFYLGETGGTHQANFEMSSVTVSYSASTFTPASRPNYGLNLQSTVLDSFVQNLLVRNALQAAVYNAGGGTTFELVHGFGYPYTCTTAPCNNSTEANSSAPDASWATNYEVIDAGSGGNMYFNTYMDSPAIAAFDLKTNGVQINGGHIQWPETTSFPSATFAEVEATVSSNLVISNVDCLNMSNTAGIPASPAGATGVWISYMAANGSSPSYSSVSNLAGCGQYVQQRVAARQTAFDAAGNNSSNMNYGSGQAGETPKVFVTPLSSQANEGGVEVENFAGGQGDPFFSGFTGQASNFAVMADGTVKHTGLQTSAMIATASTTLTKANHIVLANASSGAFTLTLPSCYTAMPDGLKPTGMEFTIVKTDTSGNAVQLASSGGQTINVLGSSSTTYSLGTAGGLTLACGPDSNYYSTEQITATGGNATTASALAATPTQCPAGSYATGIGVNGNANCAQAWRSTWYGSFAGTFGTSTNTSMGAIWSPSTAMSMTRLDVAVGTAPAGCSTYPVIGIYDSTAATWLKTVTLAAATYSYRNAVSGVSITAGHNLSMGVMTAGTGCTTNPGSAQLTMEYTPNQ